MKSIKYFYSLFVVGLIIRIALSYHMGNSDMFAYFAWGKDVLNKGLSNGYYGVYFPIQYQLFSLYTWTAKVLSIARWMVVFKGYNLIFEIGIFSILIKILEKLKLNRNYAFIYWFHPWFLLNTSQGFVDAQFTFFILLSILLLFNNKRKTLSGYTIAGIPFGIAFMLKPQVMILFFSIFVLFLLFGLTHKRWKSMLFFVVAFVLFISYSAYFAIASYFTTLTSHNILNLAGRFLILPKSYLGTVNVLPCLTCSMPNIWYPLAFYLSKGHPYTITSRIFILPNISVQMIVLVLVTLIIIYFCYVLSNSKKYNDVEKILRLTLLVSLLIPFFMTDAHVNHPYLGTVLLIPYLVKYHNKWFSVAGYVLLTALAGFLYDAYGFGLNFGALPHFIRHIPLVYFSFFSIAGFAYILFFIFKSTLDEDN